MPTLLPSPYNGFCVSRGTEKPTVLDMRNWLTLKPSVIIGSMSFEAARSGSGWPAAGPSARPGGSRLRTNTCRHSPAAARITSGSIPRPPA